MPRMEDTRRSLPRKDDGGDRPPPLPSQALGVAVQVSLTVQGCPTGRKPRNPGIGTASVQRRYYVGAVSVPFFRSTGRTGRQIGRFVQGAGPWEQAFIAVELSVPIPRKNRPDFIKPHHFSRPDRVPDSADGQREPLIPTSGHDAFSRRRRCAGTPLPLTGRMMTGSSGAGTHGADRTGSRLCQGRDRRRSDTGNDPVTGHVGIGAA